MIDEISGILDHSSACDEQEIMDCTPRIPLHPDLREHALSLLHDLVPLTWLQQLCCDWAKKRWGDAAGNDFYHYVLQNVNVPDSTVNVSPAPMLLS